MVLEWQNRGLREERRYTMPMSLAKMRHPYTLRLRPLVDDIRDRGTYLVISVLQSRFRILIPGDNNSAGIPESIYRTAWAVLLWGSRVANLTD